MLGVVLNAGKPSSQTERCQNFHSDRCALPACLGFVHDLKRSEKKKKQQIYIPPVILFNKFWVKGGSILQFDSHRA